MGNVTKPLDRKIQKYNFIKIWTTHILWLTSWQFEIFKPDQLGWLTIGRALQCPSTLGKFIWQGRQIHELFKKEQIVDATTPGTQSLSRLQVIVNIQQRLYLLTARNGSRNNYQRMHARTHAHPNHPPHTHTHTRTHTLMRSFLNCACTDIQTTKLLHDLHNKYGWP